LIVKRFENLKTRENAATILTTDELLYSDVEHREGDAAMLKNATTTLRIAETFVSRQGEGTLTGVPSFFIRTSGCNLRCWFCDTPYASWKPEGGRQNVAELVKAACQAKLTAKSKQKPAASIQHVVLTGGEPLIAAGIVELAASLRAAGMHVTIETAGTVDIEIACDLLSLSPKLRASGPQTARKSLPTGSSESWATRHEQRRMPIPTMRHLISRAPATQVKFVVDSPDEFDEILTVLADLQVPASDVWIMPQGVTNAQLDAAATWLRPWAVEAGFHYCDRMQIRWYGNRRGT
jgi:7-carboxy-7-deazaguanine synthase